MKTAVLLINLGSPENASRKEVAKFLYQMLNDKRVIDLPFILRKILVNFIIIPFSVNKSSKKYKKYFNNEESPLLTCSFKITEKINKLLPENIRAFTGMRYREPSLQEAIKKIREEKFERIVIFPQYPQYAEATTLSSIESASEFIRKSEYNPELFVIKQFHNHPVYIDCFSGKIKKYNPEKYDHVIFSYHSLPLCQVDKMHASMQEKECNCSEKTPENSHFCYKAACLETTTLIAKKLNLSPAGYSSSFQSRIGKNWLQPFTDKVLIERAEKGDKRVLIISPSFVTDCLETYMDLQIECKKIFQEHGGTELQIVDCLNDDNEWIKAMTTIITDKTSIKIK